MSSYVHHVPGRIRVKCPSLKRNEARAASLCERLLNLHGVTRAEPNTVTGSIIIHYHRNLTDARQLLLCLDHGGIRATTHDGLPVSHNPIHGMGQAGGWVGKAVFGTVMEKLIERSATALVAALI